MKDSTFTVPSTIIEGNISLTNPKDIADAFSNYFSSVATGIKSSINALETEIKNIILSLYPLNLLVQTVSQQKS